jgi:hypothetical protein
MKNIKKIVSGIVLSMFALTLVLNPTSASADNNEQNTNAVFANVHASLKADVLASREASAGVIIGADGSMKVLNAKVVSVSNTEINVNTLFGNSVLNFVVKVDGDTKINNRANGQNGVLIALLKAGDKISFSGKMLSSTSSSIVVDSDQIISRALFDLDIKNNFKGTIKTINLVDSSFVINIAGKDVKVNASNVTSIMIDKTVSTFSALRVNDEVKITGNLNADGTVLTATKVTVDHKDINKKDDEKDNKENKGWFKRIKGWFW